MNDKLSICILVICATVFGYCLRYLQECFGSDPEEPEHTQPEPEERPRHEEPDAPEELAPPEHPKGEPKHTHEFIMPRTKPRTVISDRSQQGDDHSLGRM